MHNWNACIDCTAGNTAATYSKHNEANWSVDNKSLLALLFRIVSVVMIGQ